MTSDHSAATPSPVDVGLSLFNLLWTLNHLETEMVERSDKTHLHLAGMGTFLSIPKPSQALDKINSAVPFREHTMQLRYTDHACIEPIESWTERVAAQGATVHIEMDLLHKRFHTSVSRHVV